MQAMKGATMALGSMNKSMNLPALQKIAMEFERENDIMEQRQEIMDDAMDDAMDVGVEEEGDEVVEQVLEEIGIDFNQAVRILQPFCNEWIEANCMATARRNSHNDRKPCRGRGQNCPGSWWRRRRWWRRLPRRGPPGKT